MPPKAAQFPPGVHRLPAGLFPVAVAAAAAAVLQRYPQVSLNIIPQESPLLEEWLSAQRYDLGLTETQHAPAGTERRHC